VSRLLQLIGFEDVSLIDGSNDHGGDIIAARKGVPWVFQSKWKYAQPCPADSVDEVWNAMRYYGIDRGVVVTNGRYQKSVTDRVQQLRALGVNISTWDGTQLSLLHDRAPDAMAGFQLHPYQANAVEKAWEALVQTGKALVFLATGLGKTVVAGQLVRQQLSQKPDSRILVVAHTAPLVDQLEMAMWRDIPKEVSTRLVHGRSKPDSLPGVTFAVLPTAATYVAGGYRPDMIVVDEAHHAGPGGHYESIFEKCPDVPRLGVTATPWRGDEFSIDDFFGPPVVKVSISDGMKLGYLAQVKYRLFADNIDWDFVRAASEHNYSIKDLNRRLFVPERDESVRDHLRDVWADTADPRAIVFCQTVEHADRMAALLREDPEWAGVTSVHAGLTQRERQRRLLNFRSGEIPLITSVDLLNEGVDVPDVNIICFARVTHSRRIFVQQLGRGLRLRRGKSHVEVLDFVSDIRRIAEVMDIRTQVSASELESVSVSENQFIFSDQKVESLLEQWIADVGDLADAREEARLEFPPVVGVD
jgi:superfamily II DNA or RNA helicase